MMGLRVTSDLVTKAGFGLEAAWSVPGKATCVSGRHRHASGNQPSSRSSRRSSRTGWGHGYEFAVDTHSHTSIIAERAPIPKDGARATPAGPSTNHIPPVILTIAGFDPSSGAGISADLKTFAAHQCYGLAAISALTVQNTQGVQAVHPVAPALLRDCLQSLAADGQIRAVKVGMLANAPIAKVVSEFLDAHPTLPCVLDPVLRSSSGLPLIDEPGFKFLRDRLLSQVSVVTPNLAEAAALSGLKVDGVEEMKAAAQKIIELGAHAVVVTGGHLDKPVDVYANGGGLETFAGERCKPENIHGAGCTFSAGIAAHLALGRQLADAIMLAKAYVAESIKKAYPIGPGRVPLNHFYRMQETPRSTDYAAVHTEAGA
ncbi:MAG TPA: bifunctional hydroxymethylpyrimidine kinase/phosphomethylpyrimidine kinase [Terriglobia bacterium]|nr:bifunctional hydroxymethylpyrimidine kinase/phosphomethylpyrimidine kinase [Terriglobia bacterium]